ncbi:hypothetical protein OHA72_53270 [Dactylosporangium sp. NBC_01737]|uniref:vWA domain-containing protein n=1 Tax=Dactylosporangium sp. NBC_01737 TaxID=2975959 RepID=UPI002E0E043B|nr:hypothetical protein OHA72_53270 [Dactylosporangium sp. NBC_01737]
MRETKVVPFYLMVDVSWSMGARLDAVNRFLPAVQEALCRDPVLADNIRFGFIDFADDAQVRLPLCDLLDPNVELPVLTPRGGLCFASAFEVLHQEIDINVAQLRADGYAVYRPIVWFLSGGRPSDDPEAMRRAFVGLTSMKWSPNVIPCVLDPAGIDTMAQLIHPATGARRCALYSVDAFHPEAMAGIGETLVSSVIQVGYSNARGWTGSILPPRSHLPAGITQHDPDDFP